MGRDPSPLGDLGLLDNHCSGAKSVFGVASIDGVETSISCRFQLPTKHFGRRFLKETTPVVDNYLRAEVSTRWVLPALATATAAAFAATTTAAATSTTTAAATTAAAEAAATSATAATAAAATAAVLTLFCFIHAKRATFEHCAVHICDCLGSFLSRAHGDEREATGLSRLAVGHDVDVGDLADCCERCADRISGGVKRKIADVKTITHGCSRSPGLGRD